MNILEIVNKYQDIKLGTNKNKMILTFYINNEIYKTLEIRKHKENFKILILPNKITKVIKVEELEDFILSIEKQKVQPKLNVAEIKKQYKIGQKVRLIKMYDYVAPIPPLTTGIIKYIDDLGTLHIMWEDGRRLGIIVGVDEFEIICPKCNSKMVYKEYDYFCTKCSKIYLEFLEYEEKQKNEIKTKL